jgi:hypothetical protein
VRTRRVRVAAVVPGSAERVRDAVAQLPRPVRSYVVPTGAGVLVTLERTRRWPLPSRRRVLRALQTHLNALPDMDADAPLR